MRTPVQSRPSGLIRIAVTTLFIAAICFAAFPLKAHAALQGSAGNTIIRNTVTVSYNNAVGTAQTPVTATVQITVNTVAAAPTVLAFSPTSGSTDGTGATQTYAVTIRTNSNGPGLISFGSSDGSFTNIAAGTSPTVPADILLGSTLIDPSDSHIGSSQSIAAGANITFAVPNDGGVPTDSATAGGSAGDGVINGLTSGDTVYLHDGTNYIGPFTVGTVTDSAPGSGTTATPGSIVLTNSSGSAITFTPAYGWMIVEARSVNVTVTQGAVTNPALAASWVTTVTAAMGGLNGTGTVTTDAHAGALTVTKEVSTDGGTTFTTTPSAVSPGATLTYRITVTNNGTGDVTSVVLTDPQPTYTTYMAGSARSSTTVGSGYSAGTALTDGSDGDGYTFASGTATYNAGTIGAGNSVLLFFQVSVD